jgi:hypothetical protein
MPRSVVRRARALILVTLALTASPLLAQERLTLKVLVVTDAGLVVVHDRIDSSPGEPVELRARPGSKAMALYRFTLRRVDPATCSTRL